MGEKAWIRARALELGFDGVGFARAPGAGDAFIEGLRFGEWLARGYAGEMGWLHRSRRPRAEPAVMLEGLKSVVVLGWRYPAGTPEPGPGEGRVAAYARGRDYHNVLGRKARKLLFAILARHPGSDGLSFVDRSAVLEKAWAVRAGLGWLGKNTLVLNREWGSRFLLAVLFLTLELEPDAVIAESCGDCRLCLDSCPTAAFPEPFVLDARRCISYLTIEQRALVPEALVPAMGDWLFGCDVCQDVCPFNRVSAAGRDGEPLHEPIANVLALDEEGFVTLTRGRPLARPGRAGLVRNACQVAGNSGDSRFRSALERLSEDASEVVRATALRALGQLP